MKINKLELTNITTFRGHHIIPFDQLYECNNIFAITGATGSGKSSILAAMAMGLYGNHHKSTINQIDLISLGAANAKIVVEFEIGLDLYRSVWECKLLNNKNLPLKAPVINRQLYLNQVPIEAKIEDTIGLSFNQFCKTVILNQGEFSLFLTSSFSERKNILERLSSYPNLGPISKRLKDEIKTLEDKIQTLNQVIDVTISLTETEYVETINRVKDLQITTKELQTYLWQLKLFIDDLKDLTSYVNQIIDTDLSIEKQTQTLGELESNVATTLKIFTTTENLHNTTKQTFANQTQILHEAIKLDELISNHTHNQVLATKRIDEQKQKALKTNNELQTVKNKVLNLTEKLNLFPQKDLSSTAQQLHLDSLAQKFNLFQQASYLLQEQYTQQKATNKKITSLKERRNELETTVTNLQKSLASAVKQIEILENKRHQLFFQQFRHECHEIILNTNTCPVCDQHVALIATDERLESEIHDQEYADNISSLNQEKDILINSIGAASKELTITQNDLFHQEQHRQELLSSILKISDLHSLDVDNFQTDLKEKLDNLSSEILKSKKLLIEIRDFENSINLLTSLQRELNSVQNVYNDYLQSINNEQEISNLENAKKLSLIQQRSNFKIERDPKTILEEMKVKLRDGEQQIAKARTDYLADQRKVDATKGNITLLKEQKIQIKDSLIVLISKIKQQSILLIKMPQINSEVKNAKIWNSFEVAILKISELENISNLIASNDLLQTFFREIVQEIYTLLEKEKDLRQFALAQNLEKQNNYENQKKEQEQYISEKTCLEQQKCSKDKLYQIIGKDEFRNFVLAQVEKNVLAMANLELKQLCNGRYKLIHIDRNGILDFFIADLWEAGQSRKISTLSGGETFLVSLAMALALCEMTRGEAVIDSFFIDEGFGSLDKDSIEEVLEILLNIQTRGKRIGLISHVKELTERIPINLNVAKLTPSTSHAEVVYN